jgi:cytochrome c-type biogenesis protein CcmE
MTTTDAPEVTVVARPKPRARYVVVALLCLAAIGWILYQSLGQNLVYLRPVSDAVAHRSSQGTRTFRIAGAVVHGSIVRSGEVVGTPAQRFRLTDGKATVTVVHTGDTPDLFKDDAPVVCEGRWESPTSTTFECDRVLIRHDNRYSTKAYVPPTVDSSGRGTSNHPTTP